MKKYNCEECGEDFSKNQLDPDAFKAGDYICEKCAYSLRQAAWDAVDPNHNFESYKDWDENGR